MDMHFSDGTKLESGFIMFAGPGILASGVLDVFENFGGVMHFLDVFLTGRRGIVVDV